MIKLIKNVCIFLLPFLLLVISIYFIDPYSYFHKSGNNELKRNIASISDYGRRLNLISYKNNPQPNVILGYSQADKIKLTSIPEPGWCKLTFGGADTWEVIESFNVIKNNPNLRNVVIDINAFNYMQACSRVYSKTSSHSYKAIQLLNHPHQYLYDKEVIWSSFIYLKSIISSDSSYLNRGKPNLDREKFWEHQMNTGKNVFNGNPEISRTELLQSLREIKTYCDSNNIKIQVFSSLMHTDLQKIAKEFKLKYFLPDMIETFGEIRDFAYPNDYTAASENFGDPFHATSDSIYINAIWKNDNTYCRVINRDNIHKISD